MGNTIPLHPAITEAKIEITYKDRTGYVIRVFDDVLQFADFLKENPPVAKALKYVPKPARQPAPQPPPIEVDKVKETMKQFLTCRSVSHIYHDDGLIMCAEKLLLDRTESGWYPTKLGEKYLEKLRLEK